MNHLQKKYAEVGKTIVKDCVKCGGGYDADYVNWLQTELDRMHAAALWFAQNPPGTPVPDEVDQLVNLIPFEVDEILKSWG